MRAFIQAENLKHRRTFTRKLVLLAPLVTLLLNVLAPLWFQQNSYNWWYVLLYPGFLTLICALIEQRDSGKLKYRAVFPLPVSMKNIWLAKIGVAGIYACLGNLIFLAINLAGGVVIQYLYGLPLAIGAGQAILGTICIILASLWEIPLCLWLSHKSGVFVTVLINTGIGSVMGILASTTSLWFLCPYSWVPRLMIPILHILPNGEPVLDGTLSVSVLVILLTLAAALGVLALFSLCTAKWFEEREVK